MGDNYEEVKKEIEEAIVKYKTSMPKVTKESAQTKKSSLVYVEASTPNDGKEEVEEAQKIQSPPHIVIGTESMQVDNTHITIDAKKNPFVEYGTNIVGNVGVKNCMAKF